MIYMRTDKLFGAIKQPDLVSRLFHGVPAWFQDFVPAPVGLVPCAFGGSEIQRWIAAGRKEGVFRFFRQSTPVHCHV